jgi:type II secretory pathway component PulK
VRLRRGFALLAALTLLAVLALVALDLSTRAQGRRLLAANTVAEARLRGVIDSAIEHGVLSLRTELNSADAPDPRPNLDGLNQRIGRAAVGDGWYEIRLRDPLGALNLNRADEAALVRLLNASIENHSEAEALAAAIVASRSGDPPAGSQTTRRGGPFASVDDLAQIEGMTPQVLAHARAGLTISGDGRININAASAAVLHTLPGFSLEAVEAVLSRRAAGRRLNTVFEIAEDLSADARRAFEAEFGRLADAAVTESPFVEISVTAGLQNGDPLRRAVALVAYAGRSVEVIWR